MGKPVPLHDQLVLQAEHLASKDPKRPYQANVRRSVSASYYALFHYLVFQATSLLAGKTAADDPFRLLLSRAFDHGEMARASKAFSSGWGALPPAIQPFLVARRVHPDVSAVAQAFLDLQDERHRADYDISALLLRQDAVAAVARARTAIQVWQGVAKEESARGYLTCLLCFAKVAKR
jgi:hypothetical protein